ncbi:MAG: 50S ribosomal protein L6 [Candidatus Aenigmarchaeota archaeon]|nr:50S ribosomal protein L6 [Candidatus Aenigmarchaeota archaeon]
MTVLEIPKEANIEIKDNEITVKGKLGTIKKKIAMENVEIKKDADTITINPKGKRREAKAMAGTVSSHIDNMFVGVTKGWTYTLKILYLHFPMTVKTEKDKVVITNFLGERTPRTTGIVGESKVEVKGDQIIVTGADIEDVSRTASNIERATRIKFYDRRVFQDGIFITSKGD